MNRGWLLRLACFLSVCGPLSSTPNGVTQELFRDLKRVIESQQNSIRILTEKQKNQDETIEHIREKVTSVKRSPKSENENLIHLTKDAKTLQKHANETSKTLTLLSEKLAKLEDHLAQQTSQVERLEKILTELTSAWVEESKEEQTYKVVYGDSLGKIAIQFKTTVEAIKAANDFKTDRIIVGQKLIVPEKND